VPRSLRQSLPENEGLAFIGETPWPPAQVSTSEAQSLLKARNPTGRPNADVLRQLVGCHAGQLTEQFQVDFPHHFSAQEAALYLKPFEKLSTARTASWLNPNAKPGLRTAVARLERYLATPFAAETPSWDWIDSHLLPDNSLLVIARDDDFTHGVLQSRLFQAWWQHWFALRPTPEIVMSFPFPWPPATLLSALTRTQEEHRLAIARAIRAGTQPSLDAAVTASYSWSDELSHEDAIAELSALHRRRDG